MRSWGSESLRRPWDLESLHIKRTRHLLELYEALEIRMSWTSGSPGLQKILALKRPLSSGGPGLQETFHFNRSWAFGDLILQEVLSFRRPSTSCRRSWVLGDPPLQEVLHELQETLNFRRSCAFPAGSGVLCFQARGPAYRPPRSPGTCTTLIIQIQLNNFLWCC